MASSSKRSPVPMALHVEYSQVQARAMLVPTSFFDASSFDSANDTTMIWCAGLLNGRSAIPEAQTMKRSLPLHCDVQYFQPTHDENPTRFGRINDDGIDESCEGQWTCVFTAPNLVDLAETIDSFAEHYMGIGHEKQRQFLLSRFTNASIYQPNKSSLW